MTTKLHKPVHRETEATIRDGSKQRTVIVSLLPGDVLSLRPKGTQRAELIAVSTVWMYALRLRVAAQQAEKLVRRRGGLVKRGMLSLKG
jgi:hypothetical protein